MTSTPGWRSVYNVIHMNSEVKDFFDALAPTWDKSEKCTEEEKKLFLLPILIKKGDKILDLACGTGTITKILAEKSETPVIAIDLSSEMIKVAKAKYPRETLLDFRNIDFYELPETGFDWIVCHNAYPHFLDKEGFIKKLVSSLKEGGHFAICHNRSRALLKKHHQGETIAKLTRDLLPVEEEAKDYLPYFDIELAKEDDSSYWIIGRKK